MTKIVICGIARVRRTARLSLVFLPLPFAPERIATYVSKMTYDLEKHAANLVMLIVPAGAKFRNVLVCVIAMQYLNNHTKTTTQTRKVISLCQRLHTKPQCVSNDFTFNNKF